jgi:hypothetical protein
MKNLKKWNKTKGKYSDVRERQEALAWEGEQMRQAVKFILMHT